jgi:hypothetical protein
MCFPERCLRGLSSPNWVDQDGVIETQAFMFSDRDARADDGRLSLSINWEDDDWALGHTLDQRKSDGTPQFRGGVAVVERVELDRLRTTPLCAGVFGYERQPVRGINDYHGNLLLDPSVPNEKRRRIAGTLAIYAGYEPPR